VNKPDDIGVAVGTGFVDDSNGAEVQDGVHVDVLFGSGRDCPSLRNGKSHVCNSRYHG
jgi:hypothetical protein